METRYTKQQLIRLYKDYPDVVDLKQFCEMLGGNSDCIARKLMHGDYVEHFVICGNNMISKKCKIDYVMSKHYQMLNIKLKYHIQIPDFWDKSKKNNK